jgi:dihydroorotate dehydrogenase electron transfer subunit
MMHAVQLTIVERRIPAPEHVELIFEGGDWARGLEPGQFVHVATGGTLRRPLSFSRIEGTLVGVLFRVVGEGTEWLAHRGVGERLDLLGPLGHGFPPPPAGPVALVGGGVGIPPLFCYAERWPTANLSVLLGARDRASLIMVSDFQDLSREPMVATDDGSVGHRGRVTALLHDWLAAHPDGVVMACGPTPMLQESARLASLAGRPAWLGFEQRMGCGVGACLACVVPAAPEAGRDWYRVCTDGPVFPREALYREAVTT